MTTPSIEQLRDLGLALADAADPQACRDLLRRIAALEPTLSSFGGAACAGAAVPPAPLAASVDRPVTAPPQPAPRHAAGPLVRTLTHELRQPLAAIAMYSNAAAQLVASGELRADELVQVLGRIDAQVERAAQLLARALTSVGDGQDPPESPPAPKYP
jgi:signal transduction histidine kinase